MSSSAAVQLPIDAPFSANESVRPPLKWAGGKRWQVPYVARLWQGETWRRLVEPFCGGLAITLGLKPKTALLNDVNPHLINFYRCLKAGLVVDGPRFENKSSTYYASRARFNKLLKQGKADSPQAAGLFYYLNRTGYNGLCRFNQSGAFNVPFGSYVRINYKYDFSEYVDIFAGWEFTNTHFSEIALRRDDFVYADPPYDVEFRQYSKDPEVKLTTGDEMRDRIVGALDTGCRRGEMLKIQNRQVDWRHRWIRILKEHSKTDVARVIPFEAGSRLEKLLRRRAFLGPDAYVFGEATTGAYVASLKSAWETLLLLANGIKPTRAGSGKRVSNRKALAQIDLHWHDLRHEALSRLADDGVPVHELQLLAGHSSITTTQRYMNARASSLAESMRQARERRVNRVEHVDEATAQIG